VCHFFDLFSSHPNTSGNPQPLTSTPVATPTPAPNTHLHPHPLPQTQTPNPKPQFFTIAICRAVLWRWPGIHTLLLDCARTDALAGVSVHGARGELQRTLRFDRTGMTTAFYRSPEAVQILPGGDLGTVYEGEEGGTEVTEEQLCLTAGKVAGSALKLPKSGQLGERGSGLWDWSGRQHGSKDIKNQHHSFYFSLSHHKNMQPNTNTNPQTPKNAPNKNSYGGCTARGCHHRRTHPRPHHHMLLGPPSCPYPHWWVPRLGLVHPRLPAATQAGC